MKRAGQLHLIKNVKSAFGGDLLKTRKGRSQPRPLAVRSSMHLVLRSSKAKGVWSFKVPRNSQRIKAILRKFSEKYGIKILSIGNAGNHLHLQIRISNRRTYAPFIRAVTSAIAMAVTGTSRWRKVVAGVSRTRKSGEDSAGPLRFWDRRPFTRIAMGYRDEQNLRKYIRINQIEGLDLPRNEARWIVSRGAEHLLLESG